VLLLLSADSSTPKKPEEEEEDTKMLFLSIAADHLPVSNLKMKKS